MKKITTLMFTIVLCFLLAACGGGSDKDVDLQSIYADISAKVTLPQMTQLNSADMLMSFYGIKEADTKQYVAYVSSDVTRVDEIVMIEAKDEKAAETIKSALQTRYDSQYNANVNYLPDQAAIIQNCEVSQNGRYVRMFISPDAETMVSAYNEAFK